MSASSSTAGLNEADIWGSAADDPELAQVERNIEGWSTAQVCSWLTFFDFLLNFVPRVSVWFLLSWLCVEGFETSD